MKLLKSLSQMAIIFFLALLPAAACLGGPQAGAPGKAQELRVNLAGEPETIDPNKASFSDQITVVKQVFQGLLGFNPDLTLKPVVAEEVPSLSNKGISADGLIYTFKLRSGVKWSDGQLLTARDFEYSLKRLLDPTLAANYASFYYDIKGAEEYNTALGTKAQPKTPDAAALTRLKDNVGVKATDARSLQITLKRKRPTFLQLMALWPAYPVRQDIIEKIGDKWTEPASYIGNGPFKLTEWVHADHITLEANPNYWGAKPKLQKITLKMIADPNAEYSGYLTGELDMTRVAPGNERSVLSDEKLKPELLRYPELTTFAFQFNVTKPPFDNVRVRKAFSMAIDRDAFIDKVRSGVGRPAYSWIPPGMPGFQEKLGLENKFDSGKAKKALTDAGFPDGKGLPPISFQYSDTAGNRVIAQFLQGQMKDNLGIQINLEPTESKAFQQLITQNKFSWALLGWGADYPDPDNWLPELFGTKGGNNHTGYSNPKFDEVVDRALPELDPKKRLEIWAEAQKIVVDDAPVIFLFYRERFWLKKPYVKDLKTTGQDGQIPGDWFWAETSVSR